MKRRLLTLLFGILIALAFFAVYATMQVRATPKERAEALFGDSLILHPIGTVDHAITIRRRPREVWPWLVQMGSTRAGWYAYDFIDNGGKHVQSASFRNTRTFIQEPSFPRSRGRKMYSLWCSAKLKRAWSWRGSCLMAAIKPRGHSSSKRRSRAKPAYLCVACGIRLSPLRLA